MHIFRTQPRHVIGLRWLARITGTFCFLWISSLLIVLINIGAKAGLSPFYILSMGILQFTGLILILSGFLIGWKWDRSAAGLILIGDLVRSLGVAIQSDANVLDRGIIFFPPLLGYIYLYCWWRSRISSIEELNHFKEIIRVIISGISDFPYMFLQIGKLLLKILVALVLCIYLFIWMEADKTALEPPKLLITDIPIFNNAYPITLDEIMRESRLKTLAQFYQKTCLPPIINDHSLHYCLMYKVNKNTNWHDIVKFYDGVLSKYQFRMFYYEKLQDIFPVQTKYKAYERIGVWFSRESWVEWERLVVNLYFNVVDEFDYDLIGIKVDADSYPQ